MFRDLDITLQLEDVDEELSHVGKLLLELVNELSGAWIWQFRKHIEEHSISVRLFHNLSNLLVQIADKSASWMVNDL